MRARVLPAGAPPERWLAWKRHFESGPPKELERLARAFDLDTARVLDVGCGHARHLLHFSPASLGIDRLADHVEFARALGLRAEVRDLDTLGWNLGLGDFDLVWIADLLAFVDDPVALFASLPAVLAPKGRIVVHEWLWPERETAAELLARLVPEGRDALHHPLHRRRLTEPVLAELLDAAGLEREPDGEHAVEPAALGRLLRGLAPARTIVVRPRRAAPPAPRKPDAEPIHVLEPRRSVPVRRGAQPERARAAGARARGSNAAARPDGGRARRDAEGRPVRDAEGRARGETPRTRRG